MQRTASLLSSSSSSPSFSLLPNTPCRETLLRNRSRNSISFRSCTKTPLDSSLFCRQTLPPLRCTASVTQEIVETSQIEADFVQIGYICNTHGLQGELRVKPTTDFPELRFSKPGKRWLKERIQGKETIREVEIIEGREHVGQKSWIISLHGIDMVDDAKQLVGSTLLVRAEDRPVLEEGESYNPDLVGMKVVLKDTGEPVGTVVDVFNSGGHDLLRVMLNSAKETHDETGSVKQGEDNSGPLVYVPFVEAIVPDVDLNRREIQITPPKGLLELNLRSDMRSKKERRQLEWKERKKATQRFITAKKKLRELEQKHVFDGLRFGDKVQNSLLAEQIVCINFKLFQQAMKNIGMPTMRWNLSEYMNANATKLLQNTLTTSVDLDSPHGTKNKLNPTEEMQQEGVKFLSEGKVAIVLVANDKINENSTEILQLQALLSDEKRFTIAIKEDQVSLPLIVVAAADGLQCIQNFFSDHDYFAFDTEKVWFLEEEKLPVVSSSPEEENRHKILLKTPWEILQSPVGSGGVFSLLSSHDILGKLMETGVEYVQVCSLGKTAAIGEPLFFGLVSSRGADIGIKIDSNSKDFEEDDFNMIFSMRFLKKITTQLNKLQFYEVEKQNSKVQLVDKEWVDVVPTSPNSYELHCSIYSALNACSSDKICVING